MRVMVVGVIAVGLMLGGCATSGTKGVLDSDQKQLQLRAMQTRAFDSTDKEKMMRTIISTLQDLDFLIEQADLDLGTVTGVRFIDMNVVKMTVTVRPRGETQLLVRANAQYGIRAVETPEQYQDFFTALEKAIFLTAHQVD